MADQPILIDIAALHECCTDHALESLSKALADEEGLAHDIWAAHENPFIRDLVEKFSARGLTKLEHVKNELMRWMAGEYHVPKIVAPSLPAQYLGRWSQDELDLVRIYLENIPPGELSLDDWSMVIDYTVQRYLPVAELTEQAEWLAVKSNLMGRVQAHLGTVDATTAGVVAQALPASIAEASKMFALSDVAESIMEYGRLRACESVQAVSEVTRHRLKRVILDHELKMLNGDEQATPQSLEQKLFEEFDSLNRDWRRIAVTEAGEMANQGVILSLPADSKVRRIEMYRGACPFCRKLDGRIFRVTAASDPKKDGTTDVWAGKTNIGRSSAPNKRVGNMLVERMPFERWWAAAGVQHPHCRGRWEPMAVAVAGDDPEFAKWIDQRLGHKYGL